MSALLKDFVQRVETISPLQGKATKATLHSLSTEHLNESETLMEGLIKYAANNGMDMGDLADSYLSICNNTRKEQIYFAKKGKYRLSDAEEAKVTVYEDESVMRPYMLGLAVTQIFWSHHRQLFSFFEKCIETYPYETYLEIGPGHGLFLAEAINRLPDANYTAIDLSETSLDISKDMLATFVNDNEAKFELKQADLFKWETDQKFDFITVGEVLEHVERPDVMMERIRTYLKDDGYLWASTCANCPAIDHIFLFNSAQHIRDVMTDSGFEIVDETAIETDTGLCNCQGKELPTVNYAALLKKA